MDSVLLADLHVLALHRARLFFSTDKAPLIKRRIQCADAWPDLHAVTVGVTCRS